MEWLSIVDGCISQRKIKRSLFRWGFTPPESINFGQIML